MGLPSLLIVLQGKSTASKLEIRSQKPLEEPALLVRQGQRGWQVPLGQLVPAVPRGLLERTQLFQDQQALRGFKALQGLQALRDPQGLLGRPALKELQGQAVQLGLRGLQGLIQLSKGLLGQQGLQGLQDRAGQLVLQGQLGWLGLRAQVVLQGLSGRLAQLGQVAQDLKASLVRLGRLVFKALQALQELILQLRGLLGLLGFKELLAWLVIRAPAGQLVLRGLLGRREQEVLALKELPGRVDRRGHKAQPAQQVRLDLRDQQVAVDQLQFRHSPIQQHRSIQPLQRFPGFSSISRAGIHIASICTSLTRPGLGHVAYG